MIRSAKIIDVLNKLAQLKTIPKGMGSDFDKALQEVYTQYKKTLQDGADVPMRYISHRMKSLSYGKF